MLEAIIDFINLKLELTNYFEKRHCLTKLVKAETSEGELIYPAEYLGGGDYDKVDFDAYDGVSYLRVNGDIDVSRTDENRYTPSPRVDVTIPLRLVYAVRKDKLTVDDAYSFDRVRGTIAKQLEVDAQDLVNQLGVDKVQISTSAYQIDEQEIWGEETNETGLFQPKFELVFGAMEVSVLVRAKANCIPTECDDVESDILKTFNFCSQVTQQRLTQTQVDCLTTWLCGAAEPVTIQINGVTYTTAASGDTFNQQIQNSNSTPIGTAANPSIIADSQAQVNGVNTETIAATETHNQQIHDSLGNDVGTTANPSVIADANISINSTPVNTVEAEGSLDITVNLDGSPSGSWNGTSWEVTSTPCADATVNANGVLVDNVASGGTLNIDVHDTANNDVGTVVSATEIEIGDATVTNKLVGSTWSDTVEAEGTLALEQGKALDSDGVTDLTALYIPSSQGYMFTCSPADYGTRILSVLRRQYCVDALMGFSFRYIDDEWATSSNAVCRVRRSSDNAELDFTPTEITDGTLTTWTGANDGHVVKWYDQTFNYFELFNNTAGNQAKLVTAGVLNTDTQGNPTCVTTSTFGYEIGANGGNSSRLTLFSPVGAFWAVGKKNNSTSISRMISAAGNPAVGIADITTFANANGTGTPIAIVNGSALANNQRTTLQTAINNVEHALFMHTCDWTASGNWRTSQGILAFQAYPIGSQISEFVLDKKNWSSSTIVNSINSDLQTYYGYW